MKRPIARTAFLSTLGLLASFSGRANAIDVYATQVTDDSGQWNNESLATGAPGNQDCNSNDYATSSLGGGWLKATQFTNITVPAGMAVAGVIVSADARYDTGEPAGMRIRAVWSGVLSPAGSLFDLNLAGTNCGWFDYDVTSLETSWSQAEVNSLEVWVRREAGTPTTNTLRVKAFRVRVTFGPDCNGNGILDSTDLASGGADCNANGVLDACEGLSDCDHDGIPNVCELAGNDCDGNGYPDNCNSDCDGDGIADVCEILAGAADCDGNHVMDSCQIVYQDCNGNGILDPCEVPSQLNAVNDSAQVFVGPGSAVAINVAANDSGFDPTKHRPVIIINEPSLGSATDSGALPGWLIFESSNTGCGTAEFRYRIESIVPCLNDYYLQENETARVQVEVVPSSEACNPLIFQCQVLDDCNSNGVEDHCEVLAGLATDCDGDGILDSCEVISVDCNGNGIEDSCELENGLALDCNVNGVPDACEAFVDCDGNGLPDSCDSQVDCNGNGVSDLCDVVSGQGTDCNGNSVLDECDIALGLLTNVDMNAIPDQCDVTLPGTAFCYGEAGGGGCAGCPCGNSSPETPGGCLNSAARSAVLVAIGSPSVANDSLNFYLANGTSNSFASLVSAQNLLPAPPNACAGAGLLTPLLDGKRCVGGGLLRHGSRATNSAGANANAWGTLGAPSQGLIAVNAFFAGQVRQFQCYYRDTAGAVCGTAQNTTNGLSITFVP